MHSIVPTLVSQFNRKGIDRDQVTWLIDDVELLFHRNDKISRNRLNIELESLGWGIKIVEPQTYDLIRRLVDKLRSGRARLGVG